MLLLDVSLRFSAIAYLLLTLVLALRDGPKLLQTRIVAALCLSLSGMLLNTAPAILELPIALEAAAWFIHIPNTVLLWWFGLSLFEDEFSLKPIHCLALCLVIVLMPLVLYFETIGFERGLMTGMLINRVIGLSMLLHLIWTALSGRANDLIETRRRTRLWFVLGTALVAILVISGETVQYFASGGLDDPEWFSTLRVAVILPMILFGTLWFLTLQSERFLFEPTGVKQIQTPQIEARDSPIHLRLVHAMETDKHYRQLGLSIGELARMIQVPEHQLRHVINRGLGYRNFSTFLNHYRLAEAQNRLEDVEQARIPVLTIAMDVGYASLSTFNRVFKERFGTAPSEYRAKALQRTAQN